jgi:hypothetical protein
MKMCDDFAPNFGDIRTGYCITTTHRLTPPFSPGTFDKKQHDSRPPTTLLFTVSLIEDKTERPPFLHN